MKMTKTQMILGYLIILVIVGCASYRIRTFGSPDPDVEVVPLEEVLEDNDPHLRLDDIAICTNCGHTHDCKEWLEIVYMIEDLEFLAEEEEPVPKEPILPPMNMPRKNISLPPPNL